jgi:hypothetical protein
LSPAIAARVAGPVLVVAFTTACAGGARRAGGPPPEYERPQVPEWDAGTPVDPLEQAVAAGEPVEDLPPETPDAGVPDDGGYDGAR